MKYWSSNIAVMAAVLGTAVLEPSVIGGTSPVVIVDESSEMDWSLPQTWEAHVPQALLKISPQGNITSIDLTKSKFDWAKHPAALASIDSLEAVIANHPETPSQAVASIAMVSQLRILRIAGDAIDDSNIGQLAPLANVAVLALTNTKVTDQGIAKLGHWSKLKELSLVGTPVSGLVLKTFSGCSQLTKLRIRNTPLLRSQDVISDLQKFDRLTSLELSEVELGDDVLDAVARIPKLTELNLLRTQVTSKGMNVFKGHSLKRLNLDDIQTIDDQLFPVLSTLEKLEWLHLGKTAITDAGLASLANHPTLKELLINDTAVTEKAVAELLKARPTLKCIAP